MSCSPTPYSAPASPEPYTPPRCAVPDFPPIRAGGRRQFLRRSPGRRRRSLAFGLALTAAALAASAAHGTGPRHDAAAPRGPALATDSGSAHATTVPVPHDVAEVLVRAPVRIADAAAVALLHPGDRIDVLASSRVVASNATVVAVPGRADDSKPAGESAAPDASGSGGGGALVVLAVPRLTAAALSGAAVSSPLAVTLC
ncbi:hypothetical protein [Streptomyces sp. CBMA29]|uniref:hypothetical protein n=1 Tax=Streptomyces sp. CBMA29 TaxID=1896314 RepID=UPI001661C6E9|nr:hypothetical protein [Streptomyces sp. CBMA29]MBD0734447.1 hypothetical protein [Streptomyces sp. CBMA29]